MNCQEFEGHSGSDLGGEKCREGPPERNEPLSRLAAEAVTHQRLLERLVPQTMRPLAFLAHAPLLVFHVLAVVALVELHVRVAFEDDDVGEDAVQKPAVLRDDQGAARELQQGVFRAAQASSQLLAPASWSVSCLGHRSQQQQAERVRGHKRGHVSSFVLL